MALARTPSVCRLLAGAAAAVILGCLCCILIAPGMTVQSALRGLSSLQTPRSQRLPSVILEHEPACLNRSARVFVPWAELEHEIENDHEWERRIFFVVSHGWWESWSLRHELFLSSMLLHNPNARVYMIACDPRTPPLERFLAPFVNMGYWLRGALLSCQEIVDAGMYVTSANKAWLLKHCGSTTEPHAASHMSDYLRFVLLARYGGLYTDVDSIQLRSFPPGDFIGLDFSNGTAPWFLHPEQHYYAAPGVMRLRPGATLAVEALRQAFDEEKYNPFCFGCVGPQVLNLQLRAQAEKGHGSPRFLPPSWLYPVDYLHVDQLFVHSPSAMMWLASTRSTATTIHLFGKMSAPLKISAGSVMHHLLQSSNIVAAGVREQCTLTAIAAPLVVVRATLSLRDNAAVFMNQCPRLNTACLIADTYDVHLRATLRMSVLYGHLSMKTDTAMYAALTTERSPRSLVEVELERGQLTVQAINSILSSVVYTPLAHGADMSHGAAAGIDALSINITIRLDDRDDKWLLSSVSVPILVIRHLVTVAVIGSNVHLQRYKTVFEALQAAFPGTWMTAADISLKNATASPLGDAHSKPFVWMPTSQLDAVSGRSGRSVTASALWNRIALHAHTPFVFVLDAGLTLTASFRLDLMLVAHMAATTRGAAVAGVGPSTLAAMSRHHIRTPSLVSGVLRFDSNTKVLSVDSAEHGTFHGCSIVDALPSAFLAPTRFIADSQYMDPAMPHTTVLDYFLSMQRAGVQSLACEHMTAATVMHADTPVHENGDSAHMTQEATLQLAGFRVVLEKHGALNLVVHNLNVPLDNAPSSLR